MAQRSTPEANQAALKLAEEYFRQRDPRFVAKLREVRDAKLLAPFVDVWTSGPSDWVCQTISEYISLPLDVTGHQPVVKRLFKWVEKNYSQTLMADFLVAFDRLVRRYRRRQTRHDWDSRTTWEEETLKRPSNVLPDGDLQTYTDPRTGKPYTNPRTGEVRYYPTYSPRNGRLFKYSTRYYLRRRAWRYFRQLGFRSANFYLLEISVALAKYTDADVSPAEHALDSWGLMHACFGKSEMLEITVSDVRLRAGCKFSELQPAPYFLKHWQAADAGPVLLGLVTAAKSRLVRSWAQQLILAHHRAMLSSVDVNTVLQLLEHEDNEVQQFALTLLEQSPQLATLPIANWRRLLQAKDPSLLAALCDLMRQHFASQQQPFEVWLDLATSAAVPVARLGFDFVKEQFTEGKRSSLMMLSQARCGALAKEITDWALPLLGDPAHYNRDAVTCFFDSLLPEMRAAAWDWLLQQGKSNNDPVLFTRLCETPFDDVRLKLVDELQRRSSLPVSGPHDLRGVWASVLLGVQRGGRQKLKAATQLAAAIAKRDESSADLLPVLIVALRSIRPAEMRAGLAAVVQLLEQRPDLEEIITQQLPDLKLVAEVV
ncbi:hypothetical protein NA78x_006146 [Anatilimnocola sp. NA78]|uniref:hypothetical protein n=1 Tax=Anatilimnocola sp. NA78 TaxID=3415683 RepID=UPI003CE4777A